MGKAKPRKPNTDQAAKQQLHEIKGGSVKKNKDAKFKNTPIGKIALINNSKAQNKNVKYIPSQKTAQKSFADTKNKNSPKQISKSNAKQLKQGSPNGKQNFSSKAGNPSFKGKLIFNPEKMLEQFDDSSSDSNEEATSQEDDSLNRTDETFEDEENSDTDIPDIFGKSLGDESDEDDEDFEEEEGEEDDEDSDEEETIEYKGVKMFKGLKSKTKNDEDQESNDNDDDDDEGKSDENMTFDESDEYDDEEMEEEEEEEEEEEDEDEDDKDEKQIQNIKNLNPIDISLMETDEDEYENEDDDDGEEDEDDEDDDDDNMDEEIGLKALLGKSIVDDDDDEDFNEEDEEDDEDDDISSEDEDDEENVNTVIKTITKEKTDEAANKKDVEKKKKIFEKGERWRLMEKNLVIIENISKDTTKEKIIQLFSRYGDLKQVVLEPLIVYYKNPKETTAARTEQVQPKLLSLTGKLLFKTEESASNAAKAMHGTVVDGNYLCVQTLAKFNGPYDAGKTVFITNLKKDVELNEIWKAFHTCGDIDCIELKRNIQTRQCENGYIHFFTEKAVSSAIKLRDIVKVMGRRVIVLGIKFSPDERDIYRENRCMCREDWNVKKQNEEKQGTKRNLSHKYDDKPLKKFKNNVEESVAHNAKHEENVKKHKKQQGNSEGKKSVFQGQKVSLKNKKKKLDKKKKKMAGKLTAKSAKV